MRTSEALEIIRALADGFDPRTREVFPEGTPYQHPRVVRALMTAVQALERQCRGEGHKELPMRSGRAWDKAEVEDLIRAFEKGATIVQLAKRHERSRGSIRTRLEKLGKLPSRPNGPAI